MKTYANSIVDNIDAHVTYSRVTFCRNVDHAGLVAWIKSLVVQAIVEERGKAKAEDDKLREEHGLMLRWLRTTRRAKSVDELFRGDGASSATLTAAINNAMAAFDACSAIDTVPAKPAESEE